VQPHQPRRLRTNNNGPPLPAPWSVEDIGAAFVVKDGSGQKVAYVYYEDEPGRRSAAKLLSKDEARRKSRCRFRNRKRFGCRVRNGLAVP
jgi:hypothetical protein